jgi:hypothetical protein
MDAEWWIAATDDGWLERWAESGYRQIDRFLATGDSTAGGHRAGPSERPDRSCVADYDRAIAEWFEAGLLELHQYLQQHAAFSDWLRAHGREA